MKKILKSILVIIILISTLSPISFAADVDFNNQIKAEDGSLFEKIIAECIGGIAQTIFNFTTGEDANVGFKDYDTLIFNNNKANDALSPFTDDLWSKTMTWYVIFAFFSGILILIAVIILSYKIMHAGMNTARKNEAKDSLMRLLFGGVAISLAPLFIKFLLYLNNSFVYLLVSSAGSSLDGLLGNSMLSSIRTGNAITTALVIAMFIYLFVKLNIKFIVRQFTLIIFTIFTPIAASLWIINKNVTAASIWAGQIVMNIFMQFIYCFLFIMYIVFLPRSGGWAASLIWAMMILPLADALQNCFQNLTSRIAGVDNEQMTNRALGMGAMLGYGLGAIKEQFNTPSTISSNSNISNNSNNSGGFKGFIDRAKSVINPTINLSSETDYNGNVNPIRKVINGTSTTSNISSTQNVNNTSNKSNTNKTTAKNVIGKVAKAGVSATTAYLSMGAKLTEGDFSKSPYNANNYNRQAKRNKFQSTQYINDNIRNNEYRKSGESNEFKEET